jgi:hypothetical protein
MRLFAIGIILVIISCGTRTRENDIVQYKDGRQLLNLNGLKRNGEKLDEPRIEKLSPDSISIGEEFYARIYLSDKDYHIIDAYFDCEHVDNPTVDTVANTTNKFKRLDGCKKGLIVEDDTIRIYFRGGTLGIKTFEEITILTKDTQNLFRTQRYTFDYKVVLN